MLTKRIRCLLLLVAVPSVWSGPLSHDIDRGPLAAVSDLTSAVSELNTRVANRASWLQQGDRDPRLALPTTQDLETIKKVAQILITLGEQVIPAITGDAPPSPPPSSYPCPPTEIPNDPVNVKSM
ncbi:uncharacterized protein [Epargyreus clarus]|uniref:uncharacterized protein n=1 Tax=Epargyreus clarus TaxID=520877 RepID=UPI003C2E64E9